MTTLASMEIEERGEQGIIINIDSIYTLHPLL